LQFVIQPLQLYTHLFVSDPVESRHKRRKYLDQKKMKQTGINSIYCWYTNK